MVAHIDQGYESLAVTLRGATIPNNRRPQQPGTLDEVFIPIAVKTESGRGIWWIDDPSLLVEIKKLIEECIEATQNKLSKVATNFRDLCFQHLHVLGSLPKSIVATEEITRDADGTLAYKSSATLNVKFNLEQPKSIKLGDSKIAELLVRVEPGPILPSDVKKEGKGYLLTISKTGSDGKSQIYISFPAYPYPAIKPTKSK